MLRLFLNGRPKFFMRIAHVGTAKAVIASLPQAVPLVASSRPLIHQVGQLVEGFSAGERVGFNVSAPTMHKLHRESPVTNILALFAS